MKKKKKLLIDNTCRLFFADKFIRVQSRDFSEEIDKVSRRVQIRDDGVVREATNPIVVTRAVIAFIVTANPREEDLRVAVIWTCIRTVTLETVVLRVFFILVGHIGLLTIVRRATLQVKAIVAPFYEINFSFIKTNYQVHYLSLLQVFLEDSWA